MKNLTPPQLSILAAIGAFCVTGCVANIFLPGFVSLLIGLAAGWYAHKKVIGQLSHTSPNRIDQEILGSFPLALPHAYQESVAALSRYCTNNQDWCCGENGSIVRNSTAPVEPERIVASVRVTQDGDEAVVAIDFDIFTATPNADLSSIKQPLSEYVQSQLEALDSDKHSDAAAMAGGDG